MKKKHGLIGLASLLALAGLGFWGLGQAQNRAFNQAFHQLNLAVIDDVPTIDAIGQHGVDGSSNYHVISLSQGIETSGIHQHLKPYINAAKPDKLGFWEQEWVVFYPRTQDTDLQGVSNYQLMKRTYETDWATVELADDVLLKTIHLKADGSTFSLEDLITDKESFRQTMAELWHETTEPQALKVRQDLTTLFEQDDWSGIAFQVTENSLVVDKASWSLSPFLASLNPTYFSDQTWTYLEELEASRLAMEASDQTVTVHYP